jgi:hypothetical protein
MSEYVPHWLAVDDVDADAIEVKKRSGHLAI